MRLLSFFMVVFLLAACQPFYDVTYTFKPPTSAQGKMCVMQCRNTQRLCEQLSDSNYQNCINRERQEALYAYQEYKSQRQKEGKAIKRDLRSFDRSWHCRKQSHCDEDYRACYQNCGGVISEKQVCTAFCDEK